MHARFKNWLGAGLFLLLALIPLGAGAIALDTSFVKLTANADESATLKVATDVTLDLNGYTLSSSANPAIEIQSGASLTITDTKGGGVIEATAAKAYAIRFEKSTNNNSLTITGGEIKADSTAIYGSSSTTAPKSTIMISGGTISSAISLQNSIFTITGGRIDGSLTMNPSASATIGSAGGKYNSLYIKNITASKTNNALILKSGEIGTLTQNSSLPSVDDAAVNNPDVFRVGKISTKAKLPDPYEYCPATNGEYYYIGVNSTQVAQIGDTLYTSLANALDALKDGQTLRLLQNVSENIKITEKNVTLDLGNCTVTGSVTISQENKTGANTVAIKNGTVKGNISAEQNITGPVTLELSLSTPPQNVSLLTNARMAATAENVKLLGNGGFKVTESDGDYLYGRFSSAVSHANGSVITLVNDYSGKEALSLYEGQTAVLDLDGHTYTVNGAIALNQTQPNADITVRNGTLKSVNNPDQYTVYSQADNVSMTFENVNMPSDAEYTLGVNGTVKNNDIALKDCVVTGKKAAVYFPAESHLEIRDTTISGGELGLAVKGGTVDIYGTKTKISASAALKKPTAYYPGATGQDGFTASGYAIYVEGGYDWPIDVNIHGGVFTSDGDAVFKYVRQAEAYARDISIDGGLFSSEPAKDDLAKGFGAEKTKRGYIVGQNVVVNEQGEVIGGSFVDDPREYGVVAGVSSVNQDNHMHTVTVPSTANLPKTGDQTPLLLLAALTVACGAAALALVGKRRRG